MRVIAGEFKGRRLKSLDGDNTRPTSDKIKGSIFNMIGPYFDGGICLDLYSGSGNLAIESVSRGCDVAYCFDNHFPAIKIIKENVALTKKDSAFHIKKMPANQALVELSQKSLEFDLIFLDPPYAKENLSDNLEFIIENKLLKKGGLIVCEMDKFVELNHEFGSLALKKEQIYGATKVMIYQEMEKKEDE